MINRDFNDWLSNFRDSISGYGYYIDFDKVVRNAINFKVELNILNSLIGSDDIEYEFEAIMRKYPETLRCIPLLLAVRGNEIFAQDADGAFLYKFNEMNQSLEQYKDFMYKTGLFDLISNRLVNNLFDYVLGVETGLDSNGRKNRGGHQMEDLVETFLLDSGLKKNESYFKELKISEIEYMFGLDLSAISNNGKTVKRFDFVIKTKNKVFGIETNFYASGGSKLNETARSYKQIALESAGIDGFEFVWITDGSGWLSARNNLQETFEVLPSIYNIHDLENGIVSRNILKECMSD